MRIPDHKTSQSLQGYLIILGSEVVLTFLLYHYRAGVRVEPGMGYYYLLIITLAALVWSLWHALFAVAASLIAYDFWILPPFGQVQMTLEWDERLAAFALVAMALSVIVHRVAMHRRDLQIQYQVQQRITQTLQTALLPRLQETPGYDSAFLYEPATVGANVGGDFLDGFVMEDHRFGLLLGDVTGHGLDAAVETAQLRYMLKAYALQGESPAKCLSALNRIACSDTSISSLATIFFGILDIQSHVLCFATAGQPGLLWRQRSGTTQELLVEGVLIGAWDSSANVYKESCVTLEPGDVLLLYTDGITEARREKELYGETSLASALRQLSGEPAAMAVQKLYDQVREFARGSLHDDAAILWVKRSIQSEGSPE